MCPPSLQCFGLSVSLSVMATLMRHRRGIAETEDYYYDDDDDDGGSGTAPDDTDTATTTEEAEEEEEDHRLHLGLHSMTAKGIQHLCSEFLEMKESSEQDLRANVYFSYLSFIRIAGDLDKDVHRLKHQVIAHRRLIQHLSSNHHFLYLLYHSNSSPSSSSIGLVPAACFTEEDDAGDEEEMGRRWELELDVLVSEHRMEQALEMLLLLQGQALLDDKQQQLLLQKKKAMVAERLASVAGNPRTPRPELLRALSGLCKLGESERANHLLFNWYSASVASASSKAQESIKDLARLVLSSIVGASRSFVALHHGQHHPSSSPQLLRWAREEMLEGYFSVAFSEYVRSSSMSLLLGPALEAAQYLLRSPLLRSLLGIELVGLMAPCIRDALAMYQDKHLKEVLRLMVASDTWVLGRFLISPPPHHAHAADDDAEHRHHSYSSCLLTSSGRKFLTLVQEFVHDVACPMLNLGILDDDGASLLVAELFREYMNSILELMVIVPSSRSMTMSSSSSSSNRQEEAAAGAVDDGDEQQQQYRYIISVLINCSTLVSLFPAIRTWTSSPPPGPSLQVIKEAAGQVWDCFCQHLIRDTIMSLSESQGAAAAQPQPQPEQEGRMIMMPSLGFQVVFLRMRRLKDAAAYVYGSTSTLSDEDGTMKKLLRELIEAIISWLSTNLLEMEMGSWILHGGARQAQLDIHFLIEIVRLVLVDLDVITASALDLLRKAQDKLQACAPSRSEETSAWGWAADAAKHAVQVLLHKHNNMTIGFGSSSAASAAEERESESDDDMDGSAAAAAAATVEEEVDTPAKSSDEFVSIEFEEEDDEEKKLNAPSSSDDNYNARQVDDDGICDEGENPLLAAAPEKGSSRKKKAAVTVSTSSRPRWH